MKVHHALPAVSDAVRSSSKRSSLVVAVGFFDGFHRGHRAIVRALLSIRQPGERVAIVTFKNHPATFLRPDANPPLIMTLEERINAFAAANIDEAFVLPFDAAMAMQTPHEFLDETLVERIGARAVIVGQNFRFGTKRTGDVAFARAHLHARGLEFLAVPNETDGSERISSTRVRSAIGMGDFLEADRLLGSAFTLRGRVSLGFGRGHDLGYPTANIDVPSEKMLPPDGVYSISGRLDGHDHSGLVSIGTNPTFDGRRRTVEAWLLDYRGSCYGEELTLRNFRFIRGQQRFESVDALLAQMRLDAAAIKFPSFT